MFISGEFYLGIGWFKMGLSKRFPSTRQTLGNYITAVVALASLPLLSQAFRGWRDLTPFSRFLFYPVSGVSAVVIFEFAMDSIIYGW